MHIQKTTRPVTPSYTQPVKPEAAPVTAESSTPSKDSSELSSLIGPEPSAPSAAVYMSAAKGAAIGVLTGAVLGYGANRLYSGAGLDIPTAGNIHFGGLLGGTAVGAVVGQGIKPAFDPEMRAVLGGIAGLTFTLCSTTLGAAGAVGVAAAYGGLMGGAMGFAAGMLREQAAGAPG